MHLFSVMVSFRSNSWSVSGSSPLTREGKEKGYEGRRGEGRGGEGRGGEEKEDRKLWVEVYLNAASNIFLPILV